jgi:hypothetical protein
LFKNNFSFKAQLALSLAETDDVVSEQRLSPVLPDGVAPIDEHHQQAPGR